MSYITLSSETVFNVEVGSYKGRVYKADLTAIKIFGKIPPVHLTLKQGELSFRTETAKPPIQEIKLSSFDSICCKPCMTKEYIKAVKETNSLGDKVYLKKAITNVMG
ncbi:MAG: hypothetical protein GY861_27355 [bacterium]|nr:hypothetical protein [bacterium]